MGKRSNFDRNDRDFYPTPYEAILPLLGYLKPKSTFVEPCAGDGRLVRHFEKHDHECVYACDIFPMNDENSSLVIEEQDVLFFGFELPAADYIITNPPWKRELLHDMIEVFRKQAPTWLLFDSDWLFTKQAQPYKAYCQLVIPVGRISWMGNDVPSMDNCCWYLFGNEEADTIFK